MTRLISAIFLLCILLGIFTLPIKAVVLEQQINIINQEYSTSSTTDTPTDNSLGLIEWDGSKYNQEAVYYEALVKCDTCTGGNSRISTSLYTNGGSAVTGSTVTSTSSTYTLVRSGNILSNLSNGTSYTSEIKLDATSGTAYIKAARLIVVQTNSRITDSRTHIEIGNNTFTSNQSKEIINNPKRASLDLTRYNPVPTIYFEASLKSTNGGAYAYASLSSAADCSTIITGSEVGVLGTSWGRARSGSLSLLSNLPYHVCIRGEQGFDTYISNAKIILDQSNALGITNIELHPILITTPTNVNSGTYTLANFPITFTPANFADAKYNYWYNATIKATADTAYSDLYNVSDSITQTGSEILTSQSAYDFKTSSEFTNHIPSSEKILDPELKNSNTGTTTVSAAYLIIRFADYPTFTFSINGVNSGTSTNGITTSFTSQYGLLDFGNLTPSTPKYGAHQLSVTTNSQNGYSIYSKLFNTMQGNYPANIFDSFIAPWNSPTTWTEPTGSTPNINTGWIGMNTSDTRVANWSSGSGLFGALGTTNNTVMYSNGIDTGTSIYVTYAIEVNQYQPQDLYSGTIVYTIVPNY